MTGERKNVILLVGVNQLINSKSLTAIFFWNGGWLKFVDYQPQQVV